MNNQNASKQCIPESGWRRVLAGFIDVSLVLIPASLLTIWLAAQMKSPVLFSRDSFNGIFSFPFFIPIVSVLATIYSLVCFSRFKRTLGAHWANITTIATGGQFPSKKRQLVRMVTRIIIILSIGIPLSYILSLLALGLFFLLANLFPDPNSPIGHYFFSFSDNPTKVPLLLGVILTVLSLFVYCGLLYVLLIRFWKKRGLPDILSGITVTNSQSTWYPKPLLFVSGICLLGYLSLSRIAIWVEKHTSYQVPHPSRIISTDNLTKYVDSHGWSIMYNKSWFQPNQNKEGVVFGPVSGNPDLCLAHFIIKTPYNNPNKLPLSEFVSSQETQKQFFPISSKDTKEDIQVNGITGWKVVTEKGSLNAESYSKYLFYIIPYMDKVYVEYYDLNLRLFPNSIRYPVEECIQNQSAVEQMLKTFSPHSN